MQSRLQSLIESTTNTASGFILSVAVGVIVYPVFGATFTLTQLSGLTAIFTLVSIVRGYAVRRLFNLAHARGWW